jgi:hypothetical protein
MIHAFASVGKVLLSLGDAANLVDFFFFIISSSILMG